MSRAAWMSAVLLLSLGNALAQESSVDSSRKVVHSVAPAYPPLAHQIHVSGTVKVEADVASDGTVKSVVVKGGHPLLANAAENAIRQWKFVAANQSSVETVEVRFQLQ